MPKLKLLSPSLFVIISLLVGVSMRLHQYLLNRSLWIDEAYVAINLLDRSYQELLLPLDYNQGAPYGFLVIERLSIDLFGDGERALRLFPFVSSIIALFLFVRVARYFCDGGGQAVSLGLLALCDRAIYYGSELKQYSSDLMVTLLLYAFLIGILERQAQLQSRSAGGLSNYSGYSSSRPRRQSRRYQNARRSLPGFPNVLFALVGAIAVWISHPAAFVIAGVGLWLLGEAVMARQWERLISYAATFAVPAASFVIFYVISISQIVGNAALQQSWSTNHDSFMPLPPTSLNDLKWYLEAFFTVFDYPVGIALTGIAALTFVAGGIALWQQHRQTFGLLFMPIAVTLLASGLQKYPFKGQLLLFMVPIILMVIGHGVSFIWRWSQRGSEGGWIGGAIALLLFLYPAYYAALNLNNPQVPPSFEYQRVRENVGPVLAKIQENWQADDTLYVYYASQYALRYYGDRYGFDIASALPPQTDEPYSGPWYEPALISAPPMMIGEFSRDDWSIAEREIDQLSDRVWVLFSHAYDRRSALDEQDAFVYLLDRAGTQLEKFDEVEAAAYLYQFD